MLMKLVLCSITLIKTEMVKSVTQNYLNSSALSILKSNLKCSKTQPKSTGMDLRFFSKITVGKIEPSLT